MAFYIGIDDAGRGPVIGPMILAGVLIDEKEEKRLVEIGVKDSKLLLPSKRKRIGNFLKEKFEFALQVVTPEEIDSCKNLNHLEAQKMAIVINELAQRTSEKIIAFIDCPSVNILKWISYLRDFIIDKERIEIRAEHKADSKYSVVSSASIIAKEKRELEVENLKREFHVDFGSGYPSDPKTIFFLKENFDNKVFDKIVRHSWESVRRLEVRRKQEKLF